MTDEEGNLTDNYYYDAFGNEQSNTENANPFRYAGEYFDEENGLIYLRNRYYNSSTAEDPYWNVENMIYGDENTGIPDISAIMQSTNLYVYCMNNPVNFIDPSGYITQKEIAMYNQGKLSQDVYNLLVDLGNRWANAKTEAAKDEIHNLAEQFRNNGYRYQDLSAEANNQLWANGNEMKEKMKFLPYSGPSALALAGAMWYDYVDNNGKWDYKVKPDSWMPKKEEYFVMYGKLISRADFGNINYGYTGTALGIMPTTLYKGAGYVQTRKLNDNPNQYYGDSEVDFYNVKKGIEMANAAGYKGIFELPLNLIF